MSKEIQFIILWISIVLLIVFSTLHNRIGKKTQNIIVLLLIMVFSFLYGYRTLGLDLRNYEELYNSSTVISLQNSIKIERLFSNSYEPVFTIALYYSKKFGLMFQEFLFLYVLIPQFFIFILINKLKKEPVITYMLFIVQFMFHFDLTRMFWAIPIALLAFYTDNKYLKFALYLFAFCSHYSTLLLLLYEIIQNSKFLVKMKFSMLIIGCIICSVLFVSLTKFLQNTNNRLIFKLLYTLNSQSTYVNMTQRILLGASCLYPIVMCLYIYIRCCNSPQYFDEISRKSLNTIKVAIPISIVSIGLMGIRNVSRVLLPASSVAFIAISDEMSNCLQNGRATKRGLYLLFALLLSDILTSVYYMWIAVMY